MKKILLSLLLVVVFSSVCYGAASDDVYVRQDVFDAKMETLFTRLHGDIENLGNQINGRIDALSVELRGDIKSLSERVDGNFMALSNRIDGLDKRVDDLRNNIYLWTTILGLIVLLPFIKQWYEKREEREKSVPSFTLEDVKRLIEENNVRFNLRPQV